jgi:hypothetical protein
MIKYSCTTQHTLVSRATPVAIGEQMEIGKRQVETLAAVNKKGELINI